MPARYYPVTEPDLDGEDRRHLLDAFDSGWISSQGPYLQELERSFAQFVGTRYALATANGTTALHLALLALGVGPQHEVIVPTFTYVATANAVAYCGARPVFVDCEPDTWNLDPRKLEAAITPRTAGIIPVHLYGHPCDMNAIRAIAERRRLWMVEDAAEAHGARYGGQNVGTFGDLATFSLYGNKIVTTGEGGIVCTDDPELARRVRLFRGQGMDPERRYWFPVIGYNYRLTNLAAAIGVSQVKKADRLIAAHCRVAAWYREELEGTDGLVLPVERAGCSSVSWLFSVRVLAAEGRPDIRDRLMTLLGEDGIETRPFFYPVHTMPVWKQHGDFAVADRISTSGINLPSSPALTQEDVRHIASKLKARVSRLIAVAGPA